MERTGSNSAGTAAGRRQSVSPEQEGASGTERSLPQTPTPRMPFLSIKIAKENTAVSGKRFHRRCPLTTWRVRRSTTRSDRRAVTAGGARVQQVDGWARPRKGYNPGGARTARLSRALHRISPHTEPIARQRCRLLEHSGTQSSYRSHIDDEGFVVRSDIGHRAVQQPGETSVLFARVRRTCGSGARSHPPPAAATMVRGRWRSPTIPAAVCRLRSLGSVRFGVDVGSLEVPRDELIVLADHRREPIEIVDDGSFPLPGRLRVGRMSHVLPILSSIRRCRPPPPDPEATRPRSRRTSAAAWVVSATHCPSRSPLPDARSVQCRLAGPEGTKRPPRVVFGRGRNLYAHLAGFVHGRSQHPAGEVVAAPQVLGQRDMPHLNAGGDIIEYLGDDRRQNHN